MPQSLKLAQYHNSSCHGGILAEELSRNIQATHVVLDPEGASRSRKLMNTTHNVLLEDCFKWRGAAARHVDDLLPHWLCWLAFV
jgi:hypothetical protein